MLNKSTAVEVHDIRKEGTVQRDRSFPPVDADLDYAINIIQGKQITIFLS